MGSDPSTFPTLEIPEFALHERERRDRRRLGAQDPRTEAHGNEARLHGRLLLGVSESALGPMSTVME